MRSPETAGFRCTLRQTLGPFLGVALFLAVPAVLRADQVVYFLKGKAIVVKSVEKGVKFTVLELEGGGRVGVPTEQIERIEDVQGASGVQTSVPGVTMMQPSAAQAAAPPAGTVPGGQPIAAVQSPPVVPAGGLPVLPMTRPAAQAQLGPGTGNRFETPANFMAARALQMAQGGPAIGGPGRTPLGMPGPMGGRMGGRGRPGQRARGVGPQGLAPGAQVPAAPGQQTAPQAQGTTPAQAQPAQNQSSPSQTEAAPPAHASEPPPADAGSSDADGYAADDDGEPADSASP